MLTILGLPKHILAYTLHKALMNLESTKFASQWVALVFNQGGGPIHYDGRMLRYSNPEAEDAFRILISEFLNWTSTGLEGTAIQTTVYQTSDFLVKWVFIIKDVFGRVVGTREAWGANLFGGRNLMAEAFKYIYPLVPRILEDANKFNKYLHARQERYKWINLVYSKFYGLILSRLYLGTYEMPDFTQDFKLTCKSGSLGSIMVLKVKNVHLFNGSSYALGETIRWLTAVNRHSRQFNKTSPSMLSSFTFFKGVTL